MAPAALTKPLENIGRSVRAWPRDDGLPDLPRRPRFHNSPCVARHAWQSTTAAVPPPGCPLFANCLKTRPGLGMRADDTSHCTNPPTRKCRAFRHPGIDRLDILERERNEMLGKQFSPYSSQSGCSAAETHKQFGHESHDLGILPSPLPVRQLKVILPSVPGFSREKISSSFFPRFPTFLPEALRQ